MRTPFAKLIAFVCITLQVMLGAGVGLASDSLALSVATPCDCSSPCCNLDPEPLDSCCKPVRAETAARTCCCSVAPSRAPAQPADRSTPGAVKQLRFTPAPVTTLVWVPAASGPAPRALPARDTPATRTACGITTTRIIV